MRSRHHLWAVGPAIILGACLFPTDGCGCPPLAIAAVVHGHVALASGDPVEGALARAYIAREDGCIARADADAFSRTGATGSFVLELASAADTAAICVLVRLQSMPVSSDGSALDTTVQVAFRAGGPVDSAEVNAVLVP